MAAEEADKVQRPTILNKLLLHHTFCYLLHLMVCAATVVGRRADESLLQVPRDAAASLLPPQHAVTCRYGTTNTCVVVALQSILLRAVIALHIALALPPVAQTAAEESSAQTSR